MIYPNSLNQQQPSETEVVVNAPFINGNLSAIKTGSILDAFVITGSLLSGIRTSKLKSADAPSLIRDGLRLYALGPLYEFLPIDFDINRQFVEECKGKFDYPVTFIIDNPLYQGGKFNSVVQALPAEVYQYFRAYVHALRFDLESVRYCAVSATGGITKSGVYVGAIEYFLPQDVTTSVPTVTISSSKSGVKLTRNSH